MPSFNGQSKRIANSAIKGASKRMISPEDKFLFLNKYSDLVVKVQRELYIPNQSPIVGGVLLKCVLKYGWFVAEKLCNTIKDKTWAGVDDPAYKLWLFMLKFKGRDSIELYKKAAYAIKAYAENRPISEIRMMETDILEWDSEFNVINKELKNAV